MSGYHVTLKECITIEGVVHPLPSLSVIENIIEFHVQPLCLIREAINHPIYVRSCYRSMEHEQSKKRSGYGKHTFPLSHPKGAGDYSTTESQWVEVTDIHRSKLLEIADLLIQAGFMRLAFYPVGEGFFIHADYSANSREFFLSDAASEWKRVAKETFSKAILGVK